MIQYSKPIRDLERVVFVMPVPIPWEDLASRTQEFRREQWFLQQTDMGGVRITNIKNGRIFVVEGVGYSAFVGLDTSAEDPTWPFPSPRKAETGTLERMTSVADAAHFEKGETIFEAKVDSGELTATVTSIGGPSPLTFDKPKKKGKR